MTVDTRFYAVASVYNINSRVWYNSTLWGYSYTPVLLVLSIRDMVKAEQMNYFVKKRWSNNGHVEFQWLRFTSDVYELSPVRWQVTT